MQVSENVIASSYSGVLAKKRHFRRVQNIYSLSKCPPWLRTKVTQLSEVQWLNISFSAPAVAIW